MENEKQASEMKQRLIWVDLEMTGLNPESDAILEIACIVTDADLNELAQGPVFAITHSEPVLQAISFQDDYYFYYSLIKYTNNW